MNVREIDKINAEK